MNSLCKVKDMLFTCFVVKLWNKNITQMRQKQKTTLCFISDIHIHAIYESGEKKKKKNLNIFIFTLNSFGLFTILRDSIQKVMLRYYVVSFEHDFFPSCHIVQHWGFAFDRWKCIHELDPDTITYLIEDVWTY